MQRNGMAVKPMSEMNGCGKNDVTIQPIQSMQSTSGCDTRWQMEWYKDTMMQLRMVCIIPHLRTCDGAAANLPPILTNSPTNIAIK
mmetsp:Transcript_26030/g.72627  ORF Transcript_26030/g.72627 Transcript_26030/m.72627 type:complete len:86 (-) Transcript_26030:74-331(-)